MASQNSVSHMSHGGSAHSGGHEGSMSHGHGGHVLGDFPGHFLTGLTLVLIGLHNTVAIMLILKKKKQRMLLMHRHEVRKNFADSTLLESENKSDSKPDSDNKYEFLIQPFYSASYLFPFISYRHSQSAPVVEYRSTPNKGLWYRVLSIMVNRLYSKLNVKFWIDRLEPLFFIMLALMFVILLEYSTLDEHGNRAFVARSIFNRKTGKIKIETIRRIQHSSLYVSFAVSGICGVLSTPTISPSTKRSIGSCLPPSIPLIAQCLAYTNLAIVIILHGSEGLGEVVELDHWLIVMCSFVTASVWLLHSIIVSLAESSDSAKRYSKENSDGNSHITTSVRQLLNSFTIAILRPLMVIFSGSWLCAVAVIEHTNNSLVDPSDEGAPLFVRILFCGLCMSILVGIVIMYYIVVVWGALGTDASGKSIHSHAWYLFPIIVLLYISCFMVFKE